MLNDTGGATGVLSGSSYALQSLETTFGEDLNTQPDANGHKGHLSGTVGREPVTLMVVQLETRPTTDRPCHVR